MDRQQVKNHSSGSSRAANSCCWARCGIGEMGFAVARFIFQLDLFLFLCFCSSGIVAARSLEGTVAFATGGRAHYAFDIFSLSVPLSSETNYPFAETRLTDGESVNYNGHFVGDSEKQLIFSALNDRIDFKDSHGGDWATARKWRGDILAYVSERQGRAQIYFNLFSPKDQQEEGDGGAAAAIRASKSQVYGGEDEAKTVEQQPFLQDRPSMANGCLIHVSTQQRAPSSRQSWTAVYSTNLSTSLTKRLTPDGVADLSPSVSPSGQWVLVASYGRRVCQGEVHELDTDLYMFKASDGSQRRLLVKHGGWPSWADDSTFFFHRQAEDGWWSVYRATAIGNWDSLEDVVVERVTPVGIHCFTPAASLTKNWIAIATRRPESDYRHVEIFDLQSRNFLELTNRTAPFAHHYNPFVSPDSLRVGYHKCRGGNPGLILSDPEVSISTSHSIDNRRGLMVENSAATSSSPLISRLEHIQSPIPQLSLVRVDGSFPSFSPDGSLIAYIPNLSEGGVYVMHLDGSGSRKIFSEPAFGTAWDRKREGVVYTSSGPIFASEQSTVHIVSIFNAHKRAQGDDIPLASKILTKEGTSNNAFPSPSPDGKYVVFRSGRSGHKNLYIMDAVLGEEGGLWRLTEGPWTDTMCSWSSDGQWIAFSSDRDNPGGGSFALYLIHPDGTGINKVFNSSTGGRVNHPNFSPDSKTLVFTTDYAGVSAEPISEPHQFEPSGEIFLARVDGTDVQRLTHNAYEDGTPSWGRTFITASELSKEGEKLGCSFDDVTWLTTGKENSVNGTAC